MSVFLKRGEWWITYYYRDPGGISHRKREKIGPNKRMAELALAKRRTEIVEGKFLDRRRFKHCVFQDFAVEFDEKYLKDSPGVRTHRLRMCKLADFFRNRQLSSISAFDVSRFKQHLLSKKTNKGTPPTPSTFNRYITLLKTLLNKAVEWGFIPTNPIRGLPKEKEEAKPIETLTADEKDSLLTAARKQGKDIYALISLGLNTGLRSGRLLSLKMDSKYLSEKWLSVNPGKSGPMVHMPLNDNAVEAIKLLGREDGEPLFPPRRRTSLVWKFRTLWLKLLKEAKLRKMRFHDLRHTFGTDLIEAGVDIRTVQKLLGHASIKTTERYLHRRDSNLREATAKLQLLSMKKEVSFPAQTGHT